MAILSSGGTSYPDFYICLFLLFLAFLSTPLNLLVIRHNLLKPPSLPRKLFLMLATADLLSSVYIPVEYSIGGLAGRDMKVCTERFTEMFCEEYYGSMYREATAGEIVRTAIRWIFALTPCYLTGVLAVTRFYQIKFPFGRVKEGPILAFLVFNLGYICVVFILFFRKGDESNSFAVFVPLIQGVWNFDPSFFGYKIRVIGLYLFLIFFALLLQILAIGTSFLTIREMVQMYKKPMSDTARRNSVFASLKILITNLGSIATIGVYVVKAYVSAVTVNSSWEDLTIRILEQIPWFSGFVICYTAVVPVLLSTLNPVIYIIFTPGSRKIGRIQSPAENSTLSEQRRTVSQV